MNLQSLKKCLAFEDILEGTGRCRHFINKSKNLPCGKINCEIHHNIADYLKLPYYFFKIVDTNPRVFTFGLYKKLIGMFNNCFNKNINISNSSYLREITHLIGRMNSYNKQIIIIFLFRILDSPSMNVLMYRNHVLKKTLEKKLLENNNIKTVFSIYMKNNFETKKKYFSKEKNRNTSTVIRNFCYKMIEKIYISPC